ncbi:MAG: anti-sigma factor family protein [Anaerolineales bacterium]|jgi:anti-sigma factor RsiW
MDHLPFEAMLLDVKQLTSAQRAELESHLASCTACSELARAISQMEGHLAAASMVVPAEGFSQRFQVRLQAQRRKTHERFFGLLVLMILAGVIALAVLFGGELLSLATPLVSTGLKSLAEYVRFSSLFTLIGEFISLLAENAIDTLSPAYLLAGSVAFSGLLALWVASIYRMNTQVVRKE